MYKVLIWDEFWEEMLEPIRFRTFHEAAEYVYYQMIIWREYRVFKIVEEEAV